MSQELFEEILKKISQVITRQDTKFLSALIPGLKLALRFIFVACSTQSLSLAAASL
ncbi:hypothetical protein DPMN_076490 [Dreissena polymorpha]|uniref:Uncharacterized protein n=1 Tax=Dreissena polymorpha TaxID=45954 RepID=A0A9D3YN64_DREPO|nr:hypothetical protein DPMN_076490 [Dreissena polymorpha]